MIISHLFPAGMVLCGRDWNIFLPNAGSGFRAILNYIIPDKQLEQVLFLNGNIRGSHQASAKRPHIFYKEGNPMNQRKIGTILSYVHIIVSNTISIIYTPYMLELMGQSEYGLFGTANSFISYLSILSFGIAGSYIRFNARCRANHDREEEKRLNGMFITVFSVLSVLVLIGGLACIAFAGKLVEGSFSAQELSKLRAIMLILTFNTMLSFIGSVITIALQAYEQYVFIRVVLLIAGIATPVINVIALNLGGRSVTISLLSFIVSIASYLAFGIYAKKVIHFECSFHGFQKDVIKEIFVFSGFLFINSLTDQLTHSTDNIVLGAIRGTSAVAIYTVGANFKNYFQQFSSSISSVFAPHVNMLIAQNAGIKPLDQLFCKVGRIQFYLVSLIIIGYLSIGQDFVRLWAGPEYSDSFWIGLLLMLSAFVPAFQNVGVEIQKALNKHKARSIVYFVVAIINVLLTIPFSMWWEGIGAALATLICVFMGTVVFMNYYYSVHIGLDIAGFWKSIASILPGYIAPALVGVCMNRFWTMTSFLDILLAAVILTIVFIFSTWFLSMNAYEKGLIRSVMQKVTRR